MKSFGAKIKARRKRLGWSVTKLATLAEISQSFLSRLERGTVNGSWETFLKIAGALGVSAEALYVDQSNVEAAPLGWRRIPVLDYGEAGRWTPESQQIVEAEEQETIMTNLEHSSSTFALRIKDDSMEPQFRAGDIVVIDPTVIPSPGDFVVASDVAGEATFKQYRIAGINERGVEVFELWPLNPVFAPMRSDRHQLAIIGTMVEHRSYRRH